ncbi:MAG: phage major capsid protein [Prevotella sp.]|nr:phage major capsid protein [Prevotella sp.]
METKKLNMVDVINRITAKQNLTIEEKNINDKCSKQLKEKGISHNGQFNFEMRNIIKVAEPYFVGNKKTETFVLKNDAAELIQKVNYFENNVNDLNVPYVSSANVAWGGEVAKVLDSNPQLESKKLKPHRLSTYVDYSKAFLNCTDDEVSQKVNESIVNAIYNKLFQTIFSDVEESDAHPKGLFNGITPSTITTTEDLTNMQYAIDKKHNGNVWVISPQAKQKLLKMGTNYPLLQNNELLNNPAICTNLCDDGYICYLPLDLLVIAQWGVMSLNVDNYSLATSGKVRVYIDAWFDFDLLGNENIAVGHFGTE